MKVECKIKPDTSCFQWAIKFNRHPFKGSLPYYIDHNMNVEMSILQSLKEVQIHNSFRITKYFVLEGTTRNPQVQLLSQWCPQGSHPQSWCYWHHTVTNTLFNIIVSVFPMNYDDLCVVLFSGKLLFTRDLVELKKVHLIQNCTFH